MKKRNLKSLRLNKESISNITAILGGRPPKTHTCDSLSDVSRTGTCHPTASEHAC
ncbi:hypothetical protein [Kordia jejudonensis]|uniref:hypothetical protein n=1 Tax=Kordia jejudonensis TaxID=1348245 RepID=UPI0012E080B7|nr:hypothetical protein [Kordia jejudonensis]